MYCKISCEVEDYDDYCDRRSRIIGGSYIYYHLKEDPENRVVCIGKLTYAGNLSTLAPVMVNPNFRFEKLDICVQEGIRNLFAEENPDAVINFAAESHVDRSIEDSTYVMD